LISCLEGDNASKESSEPREDTSSRKRGTADQSVVLLVPQRGEASGFIKLTTKILLLLNQYFTSCRTKYLASYFKDGVDSAVVKKKPYLCLSCRPLLAFFRCAFLLE